MATQMEQIAGQLKPGVPTMAVDELGNPFILLRDQEKMKRATGTDAVLNNIASCLKLTESVKTSFGPKGADKIIVSPDGEITVTNDGATIMEKMEIAHQATKLLVELSRSQDEQIGDGTTGIVILAGALLQEAEILIRKGLHPLKIIGGYEEAATACVKFLESKASTIDLDGQDNAQLLKVARTSLESKLIKDKKDMFSRICVDAVLSVADMKTKDVNFDLIQIHGMTGGRLEDSRLVRGVVIEKELANHQTGKALKDVKVAVLTCPFEPPKPKTKHRIEITDENNFMQLLEIEKNMFTEQIDYLRKAGVDFVVCQWGFDYEANHLLKQAGIPALRWVGGQEIEHIAMVTNARIIPRFEDIRPEKLGFASQIEEIDFGTGGDKITVITGTEKKVPACTIVLRGGNKTSIDEAERSVHDALCSVRNMVEDPRILPGGGASETHCALMLEALECEGVEQYAVKGFANALMDICGTLATNSGLDSLTVSAEVRAKQTASNSIRFGVECHQGGVTDMIDAGIFESLKSKNSQIMLATQVVKMILRINDVLSTQEGY